MTDEDGFTQDDRDAAKRMCDAVNLHVHAVLAGGIRDRPGYVAIRLSDGRSPDGVLYDSRRDATRHNLHDKNVFYVKVGRETMPEREAMIVLMLNRRARANGVVFTEEDVQTPHLTELLQPFIPSTINRLGGRKR